MRLTEPSPIAQSPLPTGTAKKYAGRWIAVRRREVVADAESLRVLVADERVKDDDALYHVPANSAFF